LKDIFVLRVDLGHGVEDDSGTIGQDNKGDQPFNKLAGIVVGRSVEDLHDPALE